MGSSLSVPRVLVIDSIDPAGEELLARSGAVVQEAALIQEMLRMLAGEKPKNFVNPQCVLS